MKNVNLLVQEDCVKEKQKKDMNVLYVIAHVATFVIKIITIVKNAFFVLVMMILILNII
ncbi:hypothetical protein [Spiroplasma citri]|uniref:hypothetical protein n=1 Tax=Spiroplasma citri TaxID=2133 RepID=UPI00286FA39A|nr:hypothetical protein [Spiroplasma citri]